MFPKNSNSLEKKIPNDPVDILEFNINLPVYEFKLYSLVDTAYKILRQTKISLKISDRTLKSFLQELLIVYNHVSYHNFSHGFSVFQVFHYFFKPSPALNRIFSYDEQFIGLIACLSHDLGHRKSNKLAKIMLFKSKRKTDYQSWQLILPCSRNSIVKCFWIF